DDHLVDLLRELRVRVARDEPDVAAEHALGLDRQLGPAFVRDAHHDVGARRPQHRLERLHREAAGLCGVERRAAARVDDNGVLGKSLVGRNPAQPVGLRGHRASRLACHRCVYTIAAVPVRAFLFDFDGLILDTETASRAGWQWLYRELGHELPPDKWALMIGTVDGWDIWGHLEELHGEPLDRASWN